MANIVIDSETGEVVNDVKIYTPEQMKAYKEKCEREERYKFIGKQIEENYKSYGAFVWILYNVGKVLDFGITGTNLTKLIYLSTYINYKNNRLMSSSEHIMTKNEMKKIINVSEATFWRFYNKLKKSNILAEISEYNDCKCLYLNPDMFLKGSISKYKDKNFNVYRMRLYTKAIRELYEKSKVNEHNLLSYLFQTIPFINIKYNILCHNPLETELELIKPMTIREYCELVNYDTENAGRLKSQFKTLRVDGLPVFNFVKNDNGLYCYVNPNVFYAGNYFKEVRTLGGFCKNDEDEKKAM